MGQAPGQCGRGRAEFRRGLTDALLDAARAHFALSKPDEKTGKTRLQVLLEVKAQTGVIAPQLRDLPPIPQETEHIWRWYTDLSGSRSAGFSVNAIAWSDIHGYFQLLDIAPHRWEVLALVALDRAFLESRINPASAKVAGAGALGARITGKAAKRSK